MLIFFSFVLFCICSQTYGTERANAFNHKVDKILVLKGKRLMLLYKDGEIVGAYKVALGKRPYGPKRYEGDLRTPEGEYTIAEKKVNSSFHRALKISYPNEKDLIEASKLGRSPGGQIMIHGLSKEMKKMGKRHRQQDWTNGCIAVTNEEIEEIWAMVDVGLPIEIRP